MTLYGECETPDRTLAVRISELTRTGCDLASGKGNDPWTGSVNGDLSLWIGAIGPLAATAMQRDEIHVMAAFKEPLDPRILAHFAIDQ